jgi:four helix bundle protein
MVLGHEKLDVYRISISYVAWVYEKAGSLNGIHRPAREQWLRASQSIALNIAEGNGKAASADRRRYFEIARGSALECAAIQDVLVVGKAMDREESKKQKINLDRIAAMLSRMGGRGYCIKENIESYGSLKSGLDPDPDPDTDSDPDCTFGIQELPTGTTENTGQPEKEPGTQEIQETKAEPVSVSEKSQA